MMLLQQRQGAVRVSQALLGIPLVGMELTQAVIACIVIFPLELKYVVSVQTSIHAGQ
jgi:hypothetical protein